MIRRIKIDNGDIPIEAFSLIKPRGYVLNDNLDWHVPLGVVHSLASEDGVLFAELETVENLDLADDCYLIDNFGYVVVRREDEKILELTLQCVRISLNPESKATPITANFQKEQK